MELRVACEGSYSRRAEIRGKRLVRELGKSVRGSIAMD